MTGKDGASSKGDVHGGVGSLGDVSADEVSEGGRHFSDRSLVGLLPLLLDVGKNRWGSAGKKQQPDLNAKKTRAKFSHLDIGRDSSWVEGDGVDVVVVLLDDLLVEPVLGADDHSGLNDRFSKASEISIAKRRKTCWTRDTPLYDRSTMGTKRESDLIGLASSAQASTRL
jgi:hypothetical protein